MEYERGNQLGTRHCQCGHGTLPIATNGYALSKTLTEVLIVLANLFPEKKTAVCLVSLP